MIRHTFAAIVCSTLLGSAAAAQCEQVKLLGSALAEHDHMGGAVDFDGNVAIVGAAFADVPASNAGAAYIFRDNGGVWQEEGYLLASDGAAETFFGDKVSIHGSVAVSGARKANHLGTASGAVYVFRFDGAAWNEEAILLASDGAAGHQFSVVSVANDTIAVGATKAGAGGEGQVYVFRHDGTSWNEEAILQASDKAAGSEFGGAVRIQGNTVVVGAPKAGALGEGQAYVFRFDGATWSERAILVPGDGAAGDDFGHTLDLDGTRVVVGSPLHDPAGAADAGAAYVFKGFGGTNWSFEAKFVASDAEAGANFGFSTAISGATIVSGAFSDEELGEEAGAVYVYQLTPGVGWAETVKLRASDHHEEWHLGSAVGVDGTTALAGAFHMEEHSIGHECGGAYVFDTAGAPCPPAVVEVTSTYAGAPGQITADGLDLDTVTSADIDGVPAAIVSQTFSQLVLQPGLGTPGPGELNVSNTVGSYEAEIELTPALSASTTGLGGSVDLHLDNGDQGIFVLVLGFQTVTTPITLASPPTYYGLLLDPATPLFVLGSGSLVGTTFGDFSFPVGTDPSLTGLGLEFQAFTQQGLSGSLTWSFTNLASLTL
jgi:hypothetical protein